MGGEVVEKDVAERHIDEANNLVTAPAYMCETNIASVFEVSFYYGWGVFVL